MNFSWNGASLRVARRSARLDQAQLAATIGSSRRAVSNWETNRVEPSPWFAERLDSVLGQHHPDVVRSTSGTLLADATVDQVLDRLLELRAQTRSA